MFHVSLDICKATGKNTILRAGRKLESDRLIISFENEKCGHFIQHFRHGSLLNGSQMLWFTAHAAWYNAWCDAWRSCFRLYIESGQSESMLSRLDTYVVVHGVWYSAWCDARRSCFRLYIESGQSESMLSRLDTNVVVHAAWYSAWCDAQRSMTIVFQAVH